MTPHEDATTRLRDGRARVTVNDRQIGPLLADLLDADPGSEAAERVVASILAPDLAVERRSIDLSLGIGWPRSR